MKKSYWLMVLILGLALFFRLFRLTELFHFTMDEELIAWRAYGLFKLHRPFLIGGISPLQVHLPPYFYYLMAVLLWPFKFNPVGWGISGAIVAILTLVSLYFLAKKLFDRQTAILAIIFQAFSFTAIFFDRHFWPMSLSPLLIVFSFSIIIRISQKKFLPYLSLALILLLALSSDPSNLVLALTLLIWFILNRKKLNSRFAFGAFFILLILFFTPLFLFDVRHQWQNFGGIVRLWQTTTAHQFGFSQLLSGLLLLPKTLTRFWYSPQTNLIAIYSYCQQYAQARVNLSWFLVMLAIFVLLWFMLKIKNSGINLLLIFYTFGLTAFGALGFPLFDHYLTGLLPVFALISAVIIRRLPKFFGYLLILIFIIFNLIQFIRVSDPYGLKFKVELVVWVNQSLNGKSFDLESISKCHRENGLRYLFELSGNPPAVSFMDGNFSWLYPQAPSTNPPEKIVTVTDKPSIGQKFGAMSVEIVNQ